MITARKCDCLVRGIHLLDGNLAVGGKKNSGEKRKH